MLREQTRFGLRAPTDVLEVAGPPLGFSPAVYATTHWSEWKPGHGGGFRHTCLEPHPSLTLTLSRALSPVLTAASPRSGPGVTQSQPGGADQKQKV